MICLQNDKCHFLAYYNNCHLNFNISASNVILPTNETNKKNFKGSHFFFNFKKNVLYHFSTADFNL